MIRPDIREAEFLPFGTSGKTRNGIVVGGDLEFVRFDYLSGGNLADILQAHSPSWSITAEKWFLFEKDQGTRRRNRSISAFFGRNGRAFQLTRLISSEAGIDGNNDESESFDIKARFSQVVKKAALEGFLILFACGCILVGIWEIEFEVPRQVTPLRSALCGFGGIFLLLIAQACFWVVFVVALG